MVDLNGQISCHPCVSYCLQRTNMQILSPQTYHQIHGGPSGMFSDQVIVELPNHLIEISINVISVNIPIEDLYESQMISSFLPNIFYSLGFLGDFHTHEKICYLSIEK